MARDTWPNAVDEVGWTAAAAAGKLGACPPGLIVGASRALHFVGDHRLVQTLIAVSVDAVDRFSVRARRPGSSDDRRDVSRGTASVR